MLYWWLIKVQSSKGIERRCSPEGHGSEGREDDSIAPILQLGAGVPPILPTVIHQIFLLGPCKGVPVDPHEQLASLDCKGDIPGRGGVEIDQFELSLLVLIDPAQS